MSTDTSGADAMAAESVRQVLDGHPVGVGGKTLCRQCGTVLREGDSVTVYAYRAADAQLWDVPAVYCERCSEHALRAGTRGTEEVAAGSRLAVTHDCATQSARLTLLACEVVDSSSPDEGGAP